MRQYLVPPVILNYEKKKKKNKTGTIVVRESMTAEEAAKLAMDLADAFQEEAVRRIEKGNG